MFEKINYSISGKLTGRWLEYPQFQQEIQLQSRSIFQPAMLVYQSVTTFFVSVCWSGCNLLQMTKSQWRVTGLS